MQEDLAKLQGSWTLHALELEGQEMPPMGGIEIAGSRFTSIGMGHEYAGTVEIDDSAKPKRFDMVFTEGPEAGNRNCGIYELDGDTWKICLNMHGKDRPRSFASKRGSGNAVEIFHRGAVPDGPPPVETPSGDGELVGEWAMVNAWQAGHPLDPRMVQTGRRITTATHTTTYFGKQVFLNAEYTTDPLQSPKTIDLSANGKTQLGIYDVAGDTMKICFSAPGKPRPTDYETRPGDGRTSAVWKRA
jgi:uncharacterized protein (TIGR03067 family)